MKTLFALMCLSCFLNVNMLFSIRYRVALTLPEPAPNIEGLAYDGENLWVADPEHDRFYKISTVDGSILATFPSPEADTALWGGPDGLAWDGAYLWMMADYNNKPHRLYRIDPRTGQVVSSYPSPGSQSDGLTFDGTYLYLSDNMDDKIYIIDPATGSAVDSFSVPGGRIEDLAWDGKFLWMVDNLDEKVMKIDVTKRVVIDQFDFAARGGLDWGGGVLWINNENYIYGLTLLDFTIFLPLISFDLRYSES